MFKHGEISFGDNVRIIESEATRQTGHADRVGVCYGLTTPSQTGVDVVGAPTDDVALNVGFDDEPSGDAWFAPELVVLVDHAGGSTATVGDSSFVKNEDGDWVPVVEPRRRGLFSRFRRT